jgi:hypothetical protein
MEAWRQWPNSAEEKTVFHKNQRTHLTPTGLLMEGELH